MPQHRILCKYYLQGACLKGDSCQFSHSFDDPSNNVCTFYQRGVCSYGSRCRYDHIKLNRPKLPYVPPFHPSPPPPSSSSDQKQSPPSPAAAAAATPAATAAAPPPAPSPTKPPLLNAWQERPLVLPPAPSFAQPDDDDDDDDHAWPEFQSADTSNLDLADRPICSFAAAGYCPYGNSCGNLHGDLCESCGKHCLHPFREAEREEHKEQCQRSQKRLELLRMSQDVECSVCLERVLSKPSMSERKFGILSGCDHPFCIGCIRDWRGGPRPPGMDVETVVRACPVCRVASHYVIPSVVWYSTPEEKEEIVSGYKNKLSSIECKYFDRGNSSCPFGTSCFYRHTYGDGRKEEVKLRHLGAADGTTVIAKNIRLSDFLMNLKK